jgi:transposase
MTCFLSDSEKAMLLAQHKQERDKRICDRIKAVLLFDKGWSYGKIASVLLLDDQTIHNYVREYKEQNKLSCNHKGSQGKLDSSQTAALKEHLDTHTYLYVKDIVSYVRVTWGITYTIPGMTWWLHKQGFTYKKPAVVPGKANRATQEQWIREYAQLKSSLQKGETICFLDGTHPTHNTRPSYGWIRKGVIKQIRTNTGRYRLNLSGAIDIFSKQIIVREDETLDTAATLSFLSEIESAYPEATKIHVFCDNARYYKNKKVQTYLTTSKIQMHFLPPYSPNLNPIERLWKFVNENVLYNKYYEKFSEFRNAVLGFLQRLNKENNFREALIRRITDHFRPVSGEGLV